MTPDLRVVSDVIAGPQGHVVPDLRERLDDVVLEDETVVADGSPVVRRFGTDICRAGVALLLQRKGGSGQEGLGKLLEDPVTSWWQKGLDRVQGKE